MQQHKKDSGFEKGISLFEILLLLASIGALSYLIGNELGFVSASTTVGAGNLIPDILPVEESGYRYTFIPSSSPTPASGISGWGPNNPLVNPTTSPSAGLQAGLTSGEELAPEFLNPTIENEMARTFMEAFNANLLAMAVNAAIAFSLYATFAWIIPSVCPTCNADAFNQLGLALSIGWGAGSGAFIIANMIGGWFTGWAATGVGALVGLGGALIGFLIFLITYREQNIEAVIFTCYPWQPVSGGADCSKCGSGQFPCTKYKCQSLGQNCELLNEGTDDELCTWVDRNDITPPTISAWEDALTEGYTYVPDSARLPPDKGVIINNTETSDGCLPPFSRITYGVSLDKPGQCRIDTVRRNTYSEMTLPGLISDGYYLYNHTIGSIYAGADVTGSETSTTIPGGGIYETYVRCESRNGYSNVGTFVFKFCVSDEPDITPPVIAFTDPINGMPVTYGRTEMPVNVYVDKPSECRWSNNNEDFDIMPNVMTCASRITEMNANMLYKCSTTLTGLTDGKENKFYFNCKSYPTKAETDRYKMERNLVYTLVGTKTLVLESLKPATGDVIKGASNSIKVTLEAQTSAGYNNGVSKCSFKETGKSDSTYVLFINTDSYQHSQELWLPKGDYDYTVKCCDLGGNCDTEETQFSVETDFESPVVIRAYNAGGKLNIATNEEAECVYSTSSCIYNFEDGLEMTSIDNINHFTEWNTGNTYYIKCKDARGVGPVSDACSITVKPFTAY
jgi:hypothetical protein